MLSEFFQRPDMDIQAFWTDVMAGLKVCRFSVKHSPGRFPIEIPTGMEPMHFEALFLQSGALIIRQKDELSSLEGWDILLLSDCSSIRSVQVASACSGILISVDASRASESLDTLSRILGRLRLKTSDLKTHMAQRGGCAVLKAAPWSRSVFAALDAMPSDRQDVYCVLKVLELLYLLCAGSPLLSEDESAAYPGGYLSRIVTDMKAYMESHLEEKLTIESMSRRFNISPTAFKSCFKNLYGQPVHQWIQTQRIKRAAELLRVTPMSVLQIAQSVGYEGLSQFNVIFKRQFGMTPRQYKKMSKPV